MLSCCKKKKINSSHYSPEFLISYLWWDAGCTLGCCLERIMTVVQGPLEVFSFYNANKVVAVKKRRGGKIECITILVNEKHMC